MNQTRVTLRDIAQKAGKSHATVSLALRGQGNLSDETRDAIKKLAQKMGYRPDPMLYALSEHRKSKSKNRFKASLAWINNFPTKDYSEQFSPFKKYKEGAVNRATELGFQVTEFHPVVDQISTAALRRIILARGISGLLLPPHQESKATWDFDLTGLPAVTFGFTLVRPKLHVVGCNQSWASALAVSKLIQYGFKKIGFVACLDLHERSRHGFVAGFLGELSTSSYQSDNPIHHYSGKIAGSGWLKWYKDYKPDAIILSGVEEARHVLASGVKIPEDVSVALLNRPDESTLWAGIDQRERDLGALAIDTVVAMINRNETGTPPVPHHVFIESDWCDGDSVKRIT